MDTSEKHANPSASRDQSSALAFRGHVLHWGAIAGYKDEFPVD